MTSKTSKRATTMVLAGFTAALVFAQQGIPSAEAETSTVDCALGESIQAAVDSATGLKTIFISGTCFEDVWIGYGDIILSGNQAGVYCDKANPGGTGEINGTVSVDGVWVQIEFLTITGSGSGVDIYNQADVILECNDISSNAETGVYVSRSSNAVLWGNTLSDNGTRATDPTIYDDCGLWVGEASSVTSTGNTYANNQYCAIEVDSQSVFTNGYWLPREPGHPADPNDRDVYIERGCDPSTGTGCFTTDSGPVAIVVWNGGLVNLQNADVSGEIENYVLSSFKVDGDAVVQGNILNQFGSMVRLRDRSIFGDRSVSYTGALTCLDTSQAFFSDVQCGETCSGAIPGSCTPTP